MFTLSFFQSNPKLFWFYLLSISQIYFFSFFFATISLVQSVFYFPFWLFLLKPTLHTAARNTYKNENWITLPPSIINVDSSSWAMLIGSTPSLLTWPKSVLKPGLSLGSLATTVPAKPHPGCLDHQCQNENLWAEMFPTHHATLPQLTYSLRLSSL